jgi:hypothetical protein
LFNRHIKFNEYYKNYIKKYSKLCIISHKFYMSIKQTFNCTNTLCNKVICRDIFICNNCNQDFCEICVIDYNNNDKICYKCYKNIFETQNTKCCNTEIENYEICYNCNDCICNDHSYKYNNLTFCYDCYGDTIDCTYCYEPILSIQIKYGYGITQCICNKYICRDCEKKKYAKKCYICNNIAKCKSISYIAECPDIKCKYTMEIFLCCNHSDKENVTLMSPRKWKYCFIETKTFCSCCTSRCKCCNEYTYRNYNLYYRNIKYSVICFKCHLKIFRLQQWWKIVMYNPNSNFCNKLFGLYSQIMNDTNQSHIHDQI